MSFEKEIKEIARIILGMYRYHQELDPAYDRQLPKINEIFSDFNKKYPKLTLSIEKTIDSITVHIYIIEDSVKKVFEVASKIGGMSSIGLSGFEESSVKDAAAFSAKVEAIADTVFITYTLEFGNETIVLEKKGDKVDFNFELKSIVNPLTPQFQLLKHYAQSDSDIDFLEKCYELGFTNIEDDAIHEWEDEFYPKMLH